MREAGRPEPYLGGSQAVAHLHQHVLVRDLEPFEHQLAVPAVLLRSHDGNAAQDAPAGLVAMKEKGGEAAPRVIRGARDQNEMLGDPGAGDEPFVPVDRPAVALALRAREHHGRIGTAAGCRLGHRESRAHPAIDDGPQPLVFLCWRAGKRQQVHVAVVGRCAIECERSEDGAVRLLVHRRPAHDRERHPAVFFRCLRRPKALRLGFRLQAAQHVEADILVLVIVRAIRLERHHVLLDEAARAHADPLDLGRQREIHGSDPVCCGRMILGISRAAPPSARHRLPAWCRR